MSMSKYIFQVLRYFGIEPLSFVKRIQCHCANEAKVNTQVVLLLIERCKSNVDSHEDCIVGSNECLIDKPMVDSNLM